MTFYDQSFLYINRKGEENRSLETFRTFSVLTATTLEQMHLFWTLSERNQRKSGFRFGLVNPLRTVDSSDSWSTFFILGKKLAQKPFLESGNRIWNLPEKRTIINGQLVLQKRLWCLTPLFQHYFRTRFILCLEIWSYSLIKCWV